FVVGSPAPDHVEAAAGLPRIGLARDDLPGDVAGDEQPGLVQWERYGYVEFAEYLFEELRYIDRGNDLGCAGETMQAGGIEACVEKFTGGRGCVFAVEVAARPARCKQSHIRSGRGD